MKKNFKIGDRVRVFSHYGPWDGEVTGVNLRGNTPRGFVYGLISVVNADGIEWYQHPRQCVRLRKKRKTVRVGIEDIARAWYHALIGERIVHGIDYSRFCKELGL